MKKIILSILFILLCSPAFALNIKTGSYTGNGTALSVTGVGFQPDYVMIRQSGSQITVWTSSSMSGKTFAYDTGGSSLVRVTSLDSDGFSLGNASSVNSNATTYGYVAIKSDGVNFKVGTYTGDGGSNRAVTGVGFQPNGCQIRHDSSSYTETPWQTTDMGTDHAQYLGANFGDSTNGNLRTLDSDGFHLGSGNWVNQTSETYYYACWKDYAGAIKTGTYTGNGSDNRSITGVGFKPTYTQIQSLGASYAAMHQPATPAATDASYGFFLEGSSTDRIQAQETDGFQIGTDGRVNTNAVAYYYWSLLDASASVASTTIKVFNNTTVNGGLTVQ